jgi:4'-phosphopantetheinyl transferase
MPGPVVELCFAHLAALRAEHVALLSAPERARRARYRREQDAARFTLAAALARLLVGRRTGVPAARVAIDRTCPRCGEPHGRPRTGGGLELSLTHSGELVGVALSDRAAVGLDLEPLSAGRDPGELLGQMLAPGEREPVGAREFCTVWTRKESVLKATGAGLALAPARVRVTPPDRPPALLAYDGAEPPAASMHDLAPALGYVAALTVLAREPARLRTVDPRSLLA